MTQPPQDPQRNVDPEPVGTPADQQPADPQPYAAPFQAEPAPAAAPSHAQPEAPVYGQPTGTPAYGQPTGQYQGQQQHSGAPYQGQQQHSGAPYQGQQFGGAPYQGQQFGGAPVSQKSKIVAGILGILLGGLGIHNFYLGFTKKALIQLLITVLSVGFLSWVSAIWGLIEGVLILISKPGEQWHRDAAGVELTD